MTRAVGAPNPVCVHRELLQSQPEDGEVGEREQWPSGGRGNKGGWEGARGTADLHSPSLHVSLCFPASAGEKQSAEPPSSLCHCHGISDGLSLTFFFAFSRFIGQEESVAVNRSATEPLYGRLCISSDESL